MKLSVIIPAHNEEESVASVLENVLALPIDLEVILVNDASTDGTFEIIDELGLANVKVIHHETNRGKGAAVRSGLDKASGDVVVIQDADLEYDPSDLPRLLAPIAEGRTKVVYGVRTLESQKWVMRWGNRFVTAVANRLYGRKLHDMETCYKMMMLEIAQSLELECRGFDVEAEITAKLLRSGFDIEEIPINYTARYENKKLSPLDGLPTLRALWKYRKW